MHIYPLAPTSHTPPDGGTRSPGTGHKTTCRLVRLRIAQLREQLDQLDELAPTLCNGHLGRLEETLKPMQDKLGDTRKTLTKWERRREVRRANDTVLFSKARN
jgi:hypothetical protein